jgi:O-antigen ligase
MTSTGSLPKDQRGLSSLVVALTVWPVLAGAILLLPGVFDRGREYFLYRGIGHLVIVSVLMAAAILNLRFVPLIPIRISPVVVGLSALVVGAAIHSLMFAEPALLLLVPSGVYMILAVLGVISAVIAFARWPSEALGRIWTAVFLSMVVYLPLFGVIFLLGPVDMALGWSGTWVPMQNIRWFAYLLVMAIAAGVALSGPPGKSLSHEEIWRAFALFVLWTILFWSGSRAQVLGLLGALVLLGVIGGGVGRRVVAPALISAALAFALSTFLPSPDVPFDFASRFDGIERDFDVLNQVSSNRLFIWATAIDLIGQRPVFGYGLGQVHVASGETVVMLHVHSFPIEAVLSFGLVGGGALIVLVFGVFWTFTRRAMRLGFSPETMPPFLVMATILLTSLVSGGVLLQTISVYLGLAAAGFWASLRHAEAEASESRPGRS